MQEHEVVSQAVKDRGITVAELARRVDMNPELLRRSLEGSRAIKTHELIALCVELGLGIGDFLVCLPASVQTSRA